MPLDLQCRLLTERSIRFRMWVPISHREFLLGLAMLALTLPTPAAIRHVLLISVDGLRGDFLEEMMIRAPDEVKTFLRLRDAGAITFNARCDAGISVTNPNHICMITGRPATAMPGLPDTAYHGYLKNHFDGVPDTIHNFGNPAVPYKASIYDVVHDHGLSTAGLMSKYKLGVLLWSYDLNNGAPDTVGEDNGRNKVDVAYYEDTGVGAVGELVTAIQNGNFKNFTMLHLADADGAGHSYGWTIADGSVYREAIRNVDGKLGAVLNAIAANPTYASQTAIILTADHGGGGEDIYGHFDRTLWEHVNIPFFVIAPGLPGKSDLYQWMENRTDPKRAVPDYLAAAQPLRNGDAANLAAAFLGLPPVPGSFMHPLLKRPLKLTLDTAGAELSWPIYLTGYTLEASDDLNAWHPIVTGIREMSTKRSYLDPAPLPGCRFYRLRTPHPQGDGS